jgi:hypothetical protein
MKSKQCDYQSYLLRMWRVSDDGINWRASLENVQTGELHGFSKLADLIEFLQEVTMEKVPEHESPAEGVKLGS